MRDLVRSTLPRDWEIDGQRVLIKPPTVRDALEVLATHEGYRKEADADTDVFKDAVRRWLPAIVADNFLAPDVDRAKVVALVLGLILEGVEPAEPSPDDKEGVGKRTMRRPFHHMLGSYCRVFRLDPYQVYTTTPWPFFLSFLKESHRQSAVEELAQMRTSLTANMKSDAIKRMGKQLEKQLGFVELSDEEKDVMDIKASESGIEILAALKAEQNAQFRTN